MNRDALAQLAYETWYAGYDMPAWEDAPAALRLRARMAVEKVLAAADKAPRARVVTLRKAS